MNARAGWLSGTPKEWPIAPLFATYEVLLGKMLNQNAIQGKHLAPYLRNVDVHWRRINVVDLPMMNFPPSVAERYRLRRNDILVCEGGEIGRSAIWRDELEECYYQKALHRLRPNRRGQLPQYMIYLLEAAVYERVFEEGASRSTIAHLTAEKLRVHRFPNPPLPTQKAIADFLDRKTAAIDSLIEKKQKLLELLAEKRAALINQAVTKGLDPGVPMKDSGIPWIGKIPAHWDIRKVAHISRRVCVGYVGPVDRHYTTTGGVPMLNTGNIGRGRLDLSNFHSITRDFHRSQRKSQVGPGDIVVARHGESGRSAVVPASVPEANCLNIVIVRPGPTMCGDYFALLFNSTLVQERLQALQGGAVQGVVNTSDIAGLRLPTPPVAEQRATFSKLVESGRSSDVLHAKLRGQIERLEEYRQALITAAVTGQLDIPEEATLSILETAHHDGTRQVRRKAKEDV